MSSVKETIKLLFNPFITREFYDKITSHSKTWSSANEVKNFSAEFLQSTNYFLKIFPKNFGIFWEFSFGHHLG